MSIPASTGIDGPGSDLSAAGRVLSTALDDPATLGQSDVDRAVELLHSGEKRARVTAAWTLGVASNEIPEAVVSAVPRIAAALADEETRPDAERALAYLGRGDPRAIEAAIDALEDERLRELCRRAIWGQGAPRTVVELDDDEETESDPGPPPGPSIHDPWAWAGGAAVAATAATDHRRSRPPTNAPAEPDAADLSYGDFEAVATLHESEFVDVLKVIYPASGGTPNAATLKRFEGSPSTGFPGAFDERIALWHSLDDHETVLPVVDWGTEPVPWVATEHVTGGDGSGLVAADREVTAWTLARVADALCHGHRHGVIHGCVTPRSVVLSPIVGEPDAWPFPRLTDWGVADVLDRHGPEAPAVPRRYAAPEQLAAEAYGAVDDATDVYGFGVTAYETLVGRSPFADGDDGTDEDGRNDGTVRPSVDPEPPSASAADSTLPSALDAVFSKCLAPRKAERYETVEAMRAEFEAALEGIR